MNNSSTNNGDEDDFMSVFTECRICYEPYELDEEEDDSNNNVVIGDEKLLTSNHHTPTAAAAAAAAAAAVGNKVLVPSSQERVAAGSSTTVQAAEAAEKATSNSNDEQQQRGAIRRLPIQSSFCGHVICQVCVLKHGNVQNSFKTKPRIWISCPICRQSKAFHSLHLNESLLVKHVLRSNTSTNRTSTVMKKQKSKSGATAVAGTIRPTSTDGSDEAALYTSAAAAAAVVGTNATSERSTTSTAANDDDDYSSHRIMNTLSPIEHSKQTNTHHPITSENVHYDDTKTTTVTATSTETVTCCNNIRRHRRTTADERLCSSNYAMRYRRIPIDLGMLDTAATAPFSSLLRRQQPRTGTINQTSHSNEEYHNASNDDRHPSAAVAATGNDDATNDATLVTHVEYPRPSTSSVAAWMTCSAATAVTPLSNTTAPPKNNDVISSRKRGSPSNGEEDDEFENEAAASLSFGDDDDASSSLLSLMMDEENDHSSQHKKKTCLRLTEDRSCSFSSLDASAVSSISRSTHCINSAAIPSRQFSDCWLISRQDRLGIARLGGNIQCTFPVSDNDILKGVAIACYNDAWQSPHKLPQYAGQTIAYVDEVPLSISSSNEFALFVRRRLASRKNIVLGWEYCGNYKSNSDGQDVQYEDAKTDVSPERKANLSKKYRKNPTAFFTKGKYKQWRCIATWRKHLEAAEAEAEAVAATETTAAAITAATDEKKVKNKGGAKAKTFASNEKENDVETCHPWKDDNATTSFYQRAKQLGYSADMSNDDLFSKVMIHMNEMYPLCCIEFVKYDNDIYDYISKGHSNYMARDYYNSSGSS